MRNKKDPEKAKRWNSIIQRWRASGLSQTAFCKQEHLNTNTFCWWKIALVGKEKATRGEKSPKASATTFVPVVVGYDAAETEARLPANILFGENTSLKVAAEIIGRDGRNCLRIFEGASAGTIAAIIGSCFN